MTKHKTFLRNDEENDNSSNGEKEMRRASLSFHISRWIFRSNFSDNEMRQQSQIAENSKTICKYANILIIINREIRMDWDAPIGVI